MNNTTFIQQGWQCPICKTVYSPSTAMCFYCNPNYSTKATSITVGGYNSIDSVDWVKHNSTTITVGGYNSIDSVDWVKHNSTTRGDYK